MLALNWQRLRSVLALFATSLGLALLTWFLITDSENEFVEQTFGFSLAVQAENVPADLVPASRIPPVTITIAGREDDLDDLSVADFFARVDLAGFPVGAHVVPIDVRSLADDIRVRGVAPATVEVVLEPVVQRTLPIVVVFNDTEPIGFERGEPELSPETVVVSGTANLIDLIDRVVAPVDLSGATVDVELPVALQARTNTGAAVSGVRISPPIADVRVAIQQELFRRSVAVAPQLVDAPAQGFRVAGVTVDPLNVVVVGTLEGLEEIGPAVTGPISLLGRNDNLVVTTPALAPDGLTLETEADVIVTIQIEPVEGQANFEVALSALGLGEGLTVSLDPGAVGIVISGPVPTLAGLNSADIRATVDLTGLDAGAHRVTVRVRFISGLRVLAVSPVEALAVVTESAAEDEAGDDESADGGAP